MEEVIKVKTDVSTSCTAQWHYANLKSQGEHSLNMGCLAWQLKLMPPHQILISTVGKFGTFVNHFQSRHANNFF